MPSVSEDVQGILDAIGQPAWVVDTAHRVRGANAAVAALLGYACRSDLLGTDGRPAALHDVAPAGSAPPAEAIPASGSGQGRLSHKSGHHLQVGWSRLPLGPPGSGMTVYVFRPGNWQPADRDMPWAEDPGVLGSRVLADRHRAAAGRLQHGAQERLVSLILSLRLVRHLEPDRPLPPAAAAELLDGALHDAEEALAHVRDVTASLYPGVLRLRGLPAALDDLATGWPALVTVSADVEHRLPETVEFHAYSMVAGALSRAVHRARARRVHIVATAHHDLTLTVTDDGASDRDEQDTLTFAAIADRARSLQGDFSLRHQPGAGTVVRLVLPIAHSAPADVNAGGYLSNMS